VVAIFFEMRSIYDSVFSIRPEFIACALSMFENNAIAVALEMPTGSDPETSIEVHGFWGNKELNEYVKYKGIVK
jgi:hypothetical protein